MRGGTGKQLLWLGLIARSHEGAVFEESVNRNYFTESSVVSKVTKDTLNAEISGLFLLIVDLFTDRNFVLAGYKTEQCTKPPRLCRQGYACPHYHNSRDRRRNPRKFKYRYRNTY